MSTALRAEDANKIIFISEAHEKFYYEKLSEVRYQDDYHKALIYCLGICNDTRNNNLVLRKFYDEISKKMDVAWNYCPFRVNKTIFVGISTFGKMWLDYNKKGQIKNVYVATESTKLHNIVENALKIKRRRENIKERI